MSSNMGSVLDPVTVIMC